MKTLWVSLTLVMAIHAQAEVLQIIPAAVPASHGMLAKGTDEIWLADTFRKRSSPSRVYTMDGQVVTSAVSGEGLTGIAKHPTQDVYSYCDLTSSKITWKDGKGETLAEFSTIENPWNARWNASGTHQYVVSYHGTVSTLDAAGKVRGIVAGLDAPFDVAPVGENSLWISEQGEKGNGKICLYREMATSGFYQKVACSEGVELKNPEGLWPLSDGGVLAVDTEAGTLIKVDPQGTSKILERDLGLPILVQALDNAGNWVVYTNSSPSGPALLIGRSPN